MDKDVLERLIAEDRSLEAIGRELGKAPSTVGYWIKKHGLQAAHAERHAARGALERDVLEALVDQHLTVREIAAALERSTATIRHWLRRYGLETTRTARRRRRAETPAGKRFRTICARHGESDFIVPPDGAARCVKCRAEAVADWRRRVKRRLVDEAGGACGICGYDSFVGALQFHHRDPSAKRFSIAGRGVALAWDVLKAEAEKCVLLCANCHAEVEAGVATLP